LKIQLRLPSSLTAALGSSASRRVSLKSLVVKKVLSKTPTKTKSINSKL